MKNMYGIEALLQPFRLHFFSNFTQGAALGCCNFEPFGLDDSDDQRDFTSCRIEKPINYRERHFGAALFFVVV